jgi:hypothetical protein
MYRQTYNRLQQVLSMGTWTGNSGDEQPPTRITAQHVFHTHFRLYIHTTYSVPSSYTVHTSVFRIFIYIERHVRFHVATWRNNINERPTSSTRARPHYLTSTKIHRQERDEQVRRDGHRTVYVLEYLLLTDITASSVAADDIVRVVVVTHARPSLNSPRARSPSPILTATIIRPPHTQQRACT